MNNKYLGMISLLLFGPEKGDTSGAGGGDIYEQIASGEADENADPNNTAGGGGEEGDKGEKGNDQSANDQQDEKDPNAEDGDFTDKDDDKPEDKGEPQEDDEKPAPTLKLDPETIAQLRGDRQEKPARIEEQMSPEQIKAILNPVEVTEQIVAELRSEDPKIAATAYQKLQLATVKNAVSIARVLIDKKSKEFEAAMGPLFEQQQQAKLSQTRTEFFTTNKDLVKYDKVVKAVSSELQQSGAFDNKTKAEIFKEVAKQTRATLKDMGITLTTPANLGAGGGGKVPNPNKASPPGRSGGDGNGQGGKQNNPDADIYSNARR